ncbi:hypothetical protein METBIDRAFT_33441 [Metschnikowia bicuspidata var. bicuspidata NRRL YB-4993]|uniref:Uncharacterized protein n=1 Tax=Metschnikowia bicuspidata var. bicuspidata NRRL YB-4993 TaxID=869754 RepID=A0A1A0H581_9ASCO|nr:hypothetical protein METBIDRAFT_33441 [Metschnikowia bicuspidata var. bicuspidata NRRL YB-4993]OBA19239.1 hypothetical protein METBIDRAFT_33441 [Metschnikowia bicuspidata var. bicuspidata NRRL YB-4993]
MNESPPPGTPRKSGKRAPTTPLVPSKTQNKKTSTAKPEPAFPRLLVMDVSIPPQAYEKELLQSKFQVWVLEKRLKEQTDLANFLELERSFVHA